MFYLDVSLKISSEPKSTTDHQLYLTQQIGMKMPSCNRVHVLSSLNTVTSVFYELINDGDAVNSCNSLRSGRTQVNELF